MYSESVTINLSVRAVFVVKWLRGRTICSMMVVVQFYSVGTLAGVGRCFQ